VQHLSDLIPPLLDLCLEAGERICHHYHAPGAAEFQSKGDDTPLTRADIDAHACLAAGLAELTPELPLLSEESDTRELAGRRDWAEFWMVDPLDGTKEFLARTGEFTINIALIREHRPVLGVLYLPLEQIAYVGIPGQLARCYSGPGWQPRELQVRPLLAGQPITVLASRRHRGPRITACIEWLEQNWGEVLRDNSGSALKFCQLADGRGDFYPRFSPCSEWDTAAGQALLEAAGGALLGLDGQPLRYNCRDTLLSPDFLALGDPSSPLWPDVLAQEF
jgi:3'(2'), 5'-bisphosphate nucleotidase